MTATPSIDLPAWMAEQLSHANPDLLRQMVQISADDRPGFGTKGSAPARRAAATCSNSADEIRRVVAAGTSPEEPAVLNDERGSPWAATRTP
jgi:hypothetical protein